MTVTEIENKINAKLAKEGRVLAEGVAEQIYNKAFKKAEQGLSDERQIDAEVDQMLKSIGQSLDGNEEQKEKHRKKLFNKNSPENHLRYCQVLVDKENEQRGVV